jgi:arylsulfatase
MVPRIYGHYYAITADLHIPEGGAEGVILAEADEMGGFSLFVQDGKLKHTYSMLGVEVYRQTSTESLPTGDVSVSMQFDADEAKPGTGGDVTLWVNDRKIGEGRVEKTVPVRFTGYAGMDVGRDNGMPVDRDAYGDSMPFAFTGTVRKVVIDLAPHPRETDRQALHETHSQVLVGHAVSG